MRNIVLISLTSLHTALGSGELWWIKPNADTNLCLDLYGGKADNGNKIDVWTCDPNAKGQQWYFNKGTFKLRSLVDSSKCIDGGDMKAGTQLQIYDCNILPQQFWGWSQDYANIFLQSTEENGPITLCMDVKDGKFQNGNPVQLAKCDGNKNGNQGLQIVTPTPPPKPYKININGKNNCLDLYGESDTNGAKIDLWACTGGKGQQWFFEAGTYKIQSVVNPKKCIDAQASMAFRNHLQLWDCPDVPQQTWGYDEKTGEIFLGKDPKKKEQCMCMSDWPDGSPLQLFTCNGAGTENWQITEISSSEIEV